MLYPIVMADMMLPVSSQFPEQVTRARVFISCGQQKDTEEVQIAADLSQKLHKLGFDPYVAVAEQTLKGVKENIFRKLSESEYFLFIDFKRERLCSFENGGLTDTQRHRGSLFSNQELALATYLEIDCAAFREIGVREEDGILGFIQANCVPFNDRRSLVDVVMKTIEDKDRGWHPNWRNELVIRRDNGREYDHVDFVFLPSNKNPARYYHVEVKNLHRSRIARNCTVYLEKWLNVSDGKEVTPELVEFKWKGVSTIAVTIPPGKSRPFDAFHIFYATPKTVTFGFNPHIVDFTGYRQLYTLPHASEHDLSFVVFSDNFAPARQTLRLSMGAKLDDVDCSRKLQDSGAL